jgi:hypothetical protein
MVPAEFAHPTPAGTWAKVADGSELAQSASVAAAATRLLEGVPANEQLAPCCRLQSISKMSFARPLNQPGPRGGGDRRPLYRLEALRGGRQGPVQRDRRRLVRHAPL